MSMAGGLAKQGMVPVIALYSTFLQRSFDMILQDICMQKLHIVIAVDRAGLVGEDGETHHGIFDVGFLRQAPNMTILSPASTAELETMMRWAVCKHDGPVAVRYPRGGNGNHTIAQWSPENPVISHKQGGNCAILTYGKLINNALTAADLLDESGVDVSVIRVGQIHPLPVDALKDALEGYQHVLIMEETCEDSGIYASLMWSLRNVMPDCKFHHIDLGNQYPTHGSVNALYQRYGLDAVSVANYLREVLKVEN